MDVTSMKQIFRKLLIKLKKQSEMDYKIQKFKAKGIKIGDNCHIYSDLPTGRDSCLLEIHNNVTIAGNCNILLHDASIGTVTNYKYTDVLGKTIIGNNVFIGFGTIVLPGVQIANNTIIGAGSVVTKSIKEEGVIVAGNPARKIGTIKDFIEKSSPVAVNLTGMTAQDVKLLIKNKRGKLITR